jgi:hypothetical protein
VTAAIDLDSPYDILSLSVVVPGRSMPIEVQIGIAGGGLVARAVLHSLRRT